MSKTLATRMAFGDELLKIAETNPDFVVCNADTKTCGLEKFGKRFPEREFSFGIAEQDLVGGAAGLAACGNKVFLATFATFASMRACEQVRTFVCYPKLNVSIIGTHTGLQVGGDGATHAAIEDVAILRAFPNMTIVQPADAVAGRMPPWSLPARSTSVCTAIPSRTYTTRRAIASSWARPTQCLTTAPT